MPSCERLANGDLFTNVWEQQLPKFPTPWVDRVRACFPRDVSEKTKKKASRYMVDDDFSVIGFTSM